MTTIHNPLVPGFNPDPSAIVVDGTCYLVTSTFEYVPGIPVYASTDLEEWRQIGNVITRPEQGRLEHVPTNGGVWAPTIRYRDGRFYVIVTIAMGRGCMVYSATDPAGPWDDGIHIEGVEGIDPDLTWDEDGTAIVTYSALETTGENAGRHRGIRQVDVDLTDGCLLSDKRDLWSGSGLMFPEAPHVYQRGDLWYLMIAEGGTERGHAVSIARGDNPRGPFEPGPANPILSARSTDRPVQNTGHGDLLDTSEGTMMVLLGVRPRGLMQAFSALGRETFLTRVHWGEDGWPTAEPVQLNPRPGTVRQTWAYGRPLDPAWLSIRWVPEDIADLDSHPGKLTLHGDGGDLTAERPTFLGRRQLNQTATVSVVVDARDGRGGLAVRYDEENVYSLTVSDDGGTATVTAEARIPGFVRTWSGELPSGPVELIFDTHRPPHDSFSAMKTSDLIGFVARSGERELRLADVDARYLSAETAVSLTGRVVGVFAVEGDVVFEPVLYLGSEG
jgi:beta-xylosidase